MASRRARKHIVEGRTLEDAVKEDADGNLVLGGDGKTPQLAQETWQDRIGVCAHDFSRYNRDDDGVWVCILPYLQGLLAETLTGMFQAHNEKAVGLFADALRFKEKEYWRSVTKAVDDVGFITSFIGLLGDELDADALFRVSVGALLREAVDVEVFVDEEFKRLASKRKKDQGWANEEYCEKWGGQPTAADFTRWKAKKESHKAADVDDPLVSFEFFASLPRVRPAIKDSIAAGRRRKYQGRKRHMADLEGDGDACNKAFSIVTGLT